MTPANQKWTSQILDEVFNALAASPVLSQKLIYKGARVLRLRLNEEIRASLDIDASFAANVSGAAQELERIRKLTHDACYAYFEGQSPVRYAIQQAFIQPRRQKGPHPRGWDVYWLNLNVVDRSDPTATLDGTPLRVDIASPEEMSENSVSLVKLNGHQIQAITLERIVGEKLRAFLSCLPAYRQKIKETTLVPRRVKDLYDLARIVRRRPLNDEDFWRVAAEEFVLACRSRCIDCVSLHTFKEDWPRTRSDFTGDPNIPTDVTFEEAENALSNVVGRLDQQSIFPIRFDLPAIDPQDK